MSHDRAGPAVLGAGAAVVLVGDLIYAATHWTGSFPRAFVTSLIALTAVALISLALRFVPSKGRKRSATRWNQRAINVVLVILMVAFIGINRASDSQLGAILGLIAGLAGGFTLYTGIWLIRQRHPAAPADSLG